jgi:hypothetical protein
MADNIKVETGNGTPERVTLDLMYRIGSSEGPSGSTTPKTQDRKYWLELYVHCYRAAHGYSLERVLDLTK